MWYLYIAIAYFWAQSFDENDRASFSLHNGGKMFSLIYDYENRWWEAKEI